MSGEQEEGRAFISSSDDINLSAAEDTEICSVSYKMEKLPSPICQIVELQSEITLKIQLL